jgi:uncharacterized protein (UPF0333 family)
MRRDDRGQALVEFALVLPIFIILVFGLVQVGMYMNARNAVAHAAQEAANAYAQTLERKAASDAAVGAATTLRPGIEGDDVKLFLVTGKVERSIEADCSGTFNDFVVARVSYVYPLPVRIGLGAEIAGRSFLIVSMEGVARVEKNCAP